MGRILANRRIVIAIFFSFVLIIGAYQLTRSVQFPPTVQASAETALLQAIAAKDSDSDGLFDWEEALYGTSPSAADTFDLGMTDGEAVAQGLVVPRAIANVPLATSSALTFDQNGLPQPAAEGTLTAAFAEHFFSLYLSAKQASGGADLTDSEMTTIASEALSSLSSVIVAAPNFKSEKDIIVSGSGSEALKIFAAQAEGVLRKNTTSASKDILQYLQDVVEKNDETALPYVASIAKGYRDSAAGLAALPVPVELISTHMDLVNTMMRVSEIANDFTRVNDDPLAAVLALQQYAPTVLNLGQTFVRIAEIYKSAGISIPAGTPGAAFVNLIEDMFNEQAVSKP
jgi:hypothetical protein